MSADEQQTIGGTFERAAQLVQQAEGQTEAPPQEPEPAPPGPPLPEPPPPEEPPAADERTYAGRYQSVDELERGYQNLRDFLARGFQQNLDVAPDAAAQLLDDPELAQAYEQAWQAQNAPAPAQPLIGDMP